MFDFLLTTPWDSLLFFCFDCCVRSCSKQHRPRENQRVYNSTWLFHTGQSATFSYGAGFVFLCSLAVKTTTAIERRSDSHCADHRVHNSNGITMTRQDATFVLVIVLKTLTIMLFWIRLYVFFLCWRNGVTRVEVTHRGVLVDSQKEEEKRKNITELFQFTCFSRRQSRFHLSLLKRPVLLECLFTFVTLVRLSVPSS